MTYRLSEVFSVMAKACLFTASDRISNPSSVKMDANKAVKALHLRQSAVRFDRKARHLHGAVLPSN
jgi:hypothetical protein